MIIAYYLACVCSETLVFKYKVSVRRKIYIFCIISIPSKNIPQYGRRVCPPHRVYKTKKARRQNTKFCGLKTILLAGISSGNKSEN